MSIEVSKYSEAKHFSDTSCTVTTASKFQFFVTIFAQSTTPINEVFLEPFYFFPLISLRCYLSYIITLEHFYLGTFQAGVKLILICLTSRSLEAKLVHVKWKNAY